MLFRCAMRSAVVVTCLCFFSVRVVFLRVGPLKWYSVVIRVLSEVGSCLRVIVIWCVVFGSGCCRVSWSGVIEVLFLIVFSVVAFF